MTRPSGSAAAVDDVVELLRLCQRDGHTHIHVKKQQQQKKTLLLSYWSFSSSTTTEKHNWNTPKSTGGGRGSAGKGAKMSRWWWWDSAAAGWRRRPPERRAGRVEDKGCSYPTVSSPPLLCPTPPPSSLEFKQGRKALFHKLVRTLVTSLHTYTAAHRHTHTYMHTDTHARTRTHASHTGTNTCLVTREETKLFSS